MNRDKVFTLRFTEKEWKGIAHRADLMDMPVGAYIRLMIDKGERVRTDTDTLSW
jgi:hypothetical protein